MVAIPQKPLRECIWQGCHNVTRRGRCDEHEAEYLGRRLEAASFYGSARWRKFRLLVLEERPLCVACPRPTPATEVDHIIPRSEAPHLAYVASNVQPLCETCHADKTRREAQGG